MYTELSHYFLLLIVLMVFVLRDQNVFWMISLTSCLLTICLFATLACYMSSDFSNYSVFTNSNLALPLFYKISATWSNHEGSLLLWCWLLSIYGFYFMTSWCETAIFSSKYVPRSVEPERLWSRNLSSLCASVPTSKFCSLSRVAPVQSRQAHSPADAHKARALWLPLFENVRQPASAVLAGSQPLSIPAPGSDQYSENTQAESGQGATALYICIILFFVIFSLFTSNPFLTIPFMCIHSIADLNPVLQDPILAIHPPCIYAGYVASAVGFSICLSAKSENTESAHAVSRSGSLYDLDSSSGAYSLRSRVDASVLHLRIWCLIAWCSFTIGILLGSWWAYHELGWGGWWFWDPVENASLMPWLLATGSIHSLCSLPGKSYASARAHWSAQSPVAAVPFGHFRQNTHSTAVAPKPLERLAKVLTICTFISCILGTFFVRSGVLASVHSFASDSNRGLFLLVFVACLIALAGLMGSVKTLTIQHTPFKSTQIEDLLVLQNLYLCILCIVVFCGTSAPIVFQWCFNRDVSTGAPFFDGIMVPLFSSVLLALVYVHYTQLSFQRSQSDRFEDQNTDPKYAQSTKSTHWWRQRAISVYESSPKSDLSFPPCASVFAGVLHLSSPYASLRLGKVVWLTLLVCALLCSHFYFFQVIANFSTCESAYAVITGALACILLKTHKFHLFTVDRRQKPLPSRLVALVAHFQKTSYMKISHGGIVLFLAGILCSKAHKSQLTQVMRYGSEVALSNNQVCTLRSIDHNYGPTFHSICGNLVVYQTEGGRPHLRSYCAPDVPSRLGVTAVPNTQNVFCMFPEKRAQRSNLISANWQEVTTTKVAIHTNWFTDFYTLIGAGSYQTGWYTSIMKLPFIFCIWIGFTLAAIGGLSSLSKQLQEKGAPLPPAQRWY